MAVASKSSSFFDFAKILYIISQIYKNFRILGLNFRFAVDNS
jgi:hypothetical protein